VVGSSGAVVERTVAGGDPDANRHTDPVTNRLSRVGERTPTRYV
jgi:hypothetical protein